MCLLPPRDDDSESSGAEVLDRLHDLLAGVHHEGAVPGHRLVEWLAGDQDQPRRLAPCRQAHDVARAKYTPSSFKSSTLSPMVTLAPSKT